MKKHGSPLRRDKIPNAGMTLGRERFAKISEVEGISLTPATKRRAAEFDREGLSPEERIRAIIEARRKG